MLLAFLAFLGGVLTILSPLRAAGPAVCLARSDQPFAKSTLPLLLGMALTFAAIATRPPLAAAGPSSSTRSAGTIALVVLALLWRRAALAARG